MARSLRRLPEPVTVAVVSTLLLGGVQLVLRHAAAVRGDELVYERMAQHPFATHTFPFAYRVAVPTLVHVLPFSHRLSFLALAVLSAGAASGFLFALLRALAAPRRLAWALAVAFAVSPAILVATIRNGRSVDPATLLVMCAAALFVVRRAPIPLAITLLLGAFVRESAMFLIPFAYAVWAQRPIDRPALVRVLAVSLPAVAVYVALRLALPTVGRELVVGYGSDGFLHERIHVVRTALSDWRVELRRVFLAFGPLWLVAPFALGRMRYARQGLVLVAPCAVAATYALDWERVFVLAAPVVVPAAAYVLADRERSDRRRLRNATLVMWLAVIIGYAGYMQHTGVRTNVDRGGSPTYPVQ